MAVTLQASATEFVKRQYCYYGINNCYRYNSPWYNWGRWVTLGVIVFVAFLIFMLVSCTNARRRKKRGQQPYYGTGWLAPHGQVQYYGENNQGAYNQQPAPPYSQSNNQNQGSYGNQNQGSYGNTEQSPYGQQSGIELQQPNNSYYPQSRGAENVYQPPTGPPPVKKGNY